LKSGDNQDMQRVKHRVDEYLAEKKPPVPLAANWFGLTYINVVWQDKMVSGMLSAFLGSFLVVLLMMIFLYRSALWGFLSMIPLVATIGLIYGVIGLIGKDYDMPVAVLSSLSLGLAVDYAIHFLSRSREIRAKTGSWAEATGQVFGEPARAISRNVIVVGIAFLPLLAAPLVPYQTVGIFIAAILFTAGVASLFVLPAAITLLEGWLFPASEERRSTCKVGTLLVAALTATGLVVVNVRQFVDLGWTDITWVGAGVIALMMVGCWLMSKGRSYQSR
jgi:predicted RND superfamily exporter protein